MLPLHEVPRSIARSSTRQREASLRAKWLHRLLDCAGWNVQETEGDYVVHDELFGTEGRVDVALIIRGRVVVCIELKAPSKPLGEEDRQQALRYGSSYYYPLNGVLNPVMVICTNGLDAYVMDPSIKNASSLMQARHLRLEEASRLKKLIAALAPEALDKKDGSLPLIDCSRKVDERPFASAAMSDFLNTFYNMVETLRKTNFATSEAIEMTVQILLLAASRDNGIIPNDFITEYKKRRDWESMASHCNALFGDVFKAEIPARKTESI